MENRTRELHVDFYENEDSRGGILYQGLFSKNYFPQFSFEITNDENSIRDNLLNVDIITKILQIGIQIGKAGYDSIALDFCGEKTK